MLQGFLRETRADSAGEQVAVRALLTDKQRAEVLAAAFRPSIAANHKLLLLGQLDLDPGAAASAGLVGRSRSFGDQAF